MAVNITSWFHSLELVRRVGWGVADQGVSSLSNFVLGVIVARSLSPSGLGAFTLAYVTFGFFLSASRGPSTDPLMVRFSGPKTTRWRSAVAASTATAMLTGIACGLACAAAGFLLPPDVGPAFIALAVGLPGILLQDSYRFAFFSCGRGDQAFINDSAWGVLMVLGLGILLATDHLTVVSSILVFGGTATLSAGFALAQSRIRPRPQLVWAWLVDHRDLGARYLIENVSVGGARQVRMSAVGIIAGLAAVGSIRAAEILMGPFLVLLSGVSQVSVPEAKKVLSASPERLARFCFWLAAVQAVAAALWGAVAFVLMPLGLGRLLLGSNWGPAHGLLLPLVVTLVLACFEIGAAAGLRSLAAARRSLSAQLASAVLFIVCGTLGAFVGGALGSCWGIAIATLAGLCIRWYQLRRALDEHLVTRASMVALA